MSLPQFSGASDFLKSEFPPYTVDLDPVTRIKHFRSPEYNYDYSLDSGFFARWGATKADNPSWSPYGPELLDLELTDTCLGGPNGEHCSYCYKGNTSSGSYMLSQHQFSTIIKRVNSCNQLTQVAFGLGARGSEHPLLFEFCRQLRELDIIPNGTIAYLDPAKPQYAEYIAQFFGACAVSYHPEFANAESVCFDTVKMLTDRGMTQVNIHLMLCDSSFDLAMDLLRKRESDPRLDKLNAIVFLGLKRCGRAKATGLRPVTPESFAQLVDYAFKHHIAIGFDSCSAPKFDAALDSLKVPESVARSYKALSERCESFLFSLYVNCQSQSYPCSFCEPMVIGQPLGGPDFDFLSWWRSNHWGWRESLLAGQRVCPVYEV